jgi:hypothetical protein
MNKVRKFLKEELGLELSEEKTNITNVNLEQAEFLSVKIKRSGHTTFSHKKNVLTRNVKNIRLTASIEMVTKKLADSGFLKENEPSPKFL